MFFPLSQLKVLAIQTSSPTLPSIFFQRSYIPIIKTKIKTGFEFFKFSHSINLFSHEYYYIHQKTAFLKKHFSKKKMIEIIFLYYNFKQSSSDTCSHHSLLVSSPGTSIAMWENHESFLAPCQCLTLAGMTITFPGTSSTASFPSS